MLPSLSKATVEVWLTMAGSRLKKTVMMMTSCGDITRASAVSSESQRRVSKRISSLGKSLLGCVLVNQSLINRSVHERRKQLPAPVATPNHASVAAFSTRSLEEQQAALTLSQLAQPDNGVNQLIQALVVSKSFSIWADLS